MHILKLSFIILVASLFSNIAHTQGIETALVNYTANAPQEKLYVQFDNGKYAPGQTIWYKAYLMNGFQPSFISKNFYIDWYNQNGVLIHSTITPIIDSYSSGNFKVPDNFNGNILNAVAYTKWMRNFDSTYFYKQQFPILNNRTQSSDISANVDSTTVQFLAESGSFISNKINIIAFKAINGKGLPVNIKGVIRNDNNDSITSFKTLHDGMGKFQLIPNQEEHYTAFWKNASGELHKTKLPLPENNGLNIIIEPGRSNRIFHIQRTGTAGESLSQTTLVGQMNGSILFTSKIDLSEKESITSILPLSKMLTGLLQLTLFDKNNTPVCERILFVKNEDYKFNVTVNVDTLITTKRGKNVVEFELQDSIYANLSLAITDASLNDDPQNNIISHLLLNGELSGNIYNPTYYFNSTADSVSNHLDLVMLTNGWRRYNWQQILSKQQKELVFPKDTGYQTLNGQIADYASRKNKKSESINLIFVGKDSSNNMITLPISENGTFTSNNAILYDTVKIYYKINGTTAISNKNLYIKNDLFKINTLKPFSNNLINYDTTGFSKLQVLINEKIRFDSINRYNTLKQVTVYAKQKTRIQELDKRYTLGIFSGEAAASFDMNTLENAAHQSSIFDFLTGKVPGLQFTNGASGTIKEVAVFRGGRPTFYLNENPINEIDIDNIEMSDIAYVKVFNPPFLSGANIASGVSKVHESSGAIAIYTKKGEDLKSKSNNFQASGLDYATNIGYTTPKEFYAPNYAEIEQASKFKDIRTTLLWNPWITLNKLNRKVKFSFYNNDVTTKFRLILEGMNSKGQLISINKLLN